MPFYQPGHFESRARVALPLLGVVLTVSFLLVGLFDDLEPSPPDGELVDATVYTVVPDSLGRPYYVAVRAVTSKGAVSCSLGKTSFPDGVLPPLNARIPLDWTPEYCTRYDPADQLPRWFFFTVAGIAGTLTGSWLYRKLSR
ncbi:hypothetical protein AB0M02_22560 [Actinoplanes sp. NPDC051861]|uniref:hypothetical protein n=1 Tax=Actinoplanes sp. NPDC051861 TaxID=3155170 RepID=UPI00343DE909